MTSEELFKEIIRQVDDLKKSQPRFSVTNAIKLEDIKATAYKGVIAEKDKHAKSTSGAI